MPEQDPLDAYKRAREAKKASPGPAPGAAKPRPKATVPAATPRPAVPPPRPKTGMIAKPGTPAAKPVAAASKPAPAAPKPRVVRHHFDKADLAKMPDDRGFDPGKPAVQRGAFHEDDLGKMAEVGDRGPPEGQKARGLVKHRFAKADVAKMVEDRDFQPEKPALQRGAFHGDDLAKMAETDETGPAQPQKPRGMVKHRFAKADVAKMRNEKGEVARPAGLTRDGFGPGVRRAAADEPGATAEAPRRRAGGMLSSGHTRRHAKDLAAEPRPAPRTESTEGDAPAGG